MSWTPRSYRHPGSMTPLHHTPRDHPHMTSFEVKMMELERLKKEISRHMCRLNSVRIQYTDWFEKRRQSFIDSIKLLQLTYPEVVPPQHNTVALFRRMYDTAQVLPKRGLPVDRSAERLAELEHFIDAVGGLKKDHDLLYEKICTYCCSITLLRDPYLKDTIDDYQKTLNIAFQEDFDFDQVHNEKDNLFTYKLAQQDHTFHGLLAYVPYVLKVAVDMCYWSCQLYLEKE